MEGFDISRRHYGQIGFADHLLRKRASKRADKLERTLGLIDWRCLDCLLDPLRGSRRGAPGYPPLCLFKVLLLAQWYDLSDPGLEDALERIPEKCVRFSAKNTR